MEREPYASRLFRLRRSLKNSTSMPSWWRSLKTATYLSGYGAEDLQLTESSGYLLITDSKQYLLTDFRYQEEAKTEAPDYQVLIYSEGLGHTLSELFSELPLDEVGNGAPPSDSQPLSRSGGGPQESSSPASWFLQKTWWNV